MADFSGIDAMAVLTIATQQVIKEAKKISGAAEPEQIKKDSGAEVKRGSFDWFLDKFIAPATNQEMARFAAESANRFVKFEGNTDKYKF
jgi:membrane-bound lytic murein transglycosylase B